MSKLISIIIPVYNGEKYLEDCLNSIKNQTFENLEVIIIDDGSSDGSINIARNFVENDGRFIIIETENRGVSRARNLGLEIAKGEYIGFVDCDDIIEPRMYEKLYSILEEICDNNVIACCSFNNQINNLNIISRDNNKIEIWNNEKSISELFVNKLVQGFVWNKLYPKKILKDKIYFDYKIFSHEDLLFNFKVLENNSVKIAFTNEELYHYRINESGCMFSSRFSKKRLTAINAYEQMLNVEWLTKPNLEIIRGQFVLVNLILISNILKSKENINNELISLLIKNIKKYRREFFKSKVNIKYKIGYILLNLSPTLFYNINK